MFQKKSYTYFCLLIFFLSSCKEKESRITRITLNDFYIDTLNQNGLFKAIIPIKKDSVSTKKKYPTRSGYFLIDETNETLKISAEVYIRDGKKYMKVDTDRDGQLDDEKEYKIGKKSGIIPIPDCSILVRGEEKKITLYLKPFESTLFKAKSELDLENIGLLYLPVRNRGTLQIRNEYTFSLYKFESQVFNPVNAIINCEQKGITDAKKLNYKVGDNIYLDRKIFSVVNIDSLGRFLDLRHEGVTDKNSGFMVGDHALEIEGNDVLTQENIKISLLDKKLTLLDFWGTWCTPCLKTTDSLISLSKRHGDNLSIVGIACDYKLSNVKNYITKKNINYSNIFEDYGGAIETKYVVREFPTFILLDADKKIIFRGAGFDNFQEVVKLIESYLSK